MHWSIHLKNHAATDIHLLLFASLCCASALVTPTWAAKINWTGAAGDRSWNNPGNWDLGRLPTAADQAILGNSAGPIYIQGSGTVGSIQFAEQGFQFFGDRLEVVGDEGLTVGHFSTMATPLKFENPSVIDIVEDKGLILSGALVARDGLEKAGGGTLTLNNGLEVDISSLRIREGTVSLGGANLGSATVLGNVVVGESGILALESRSTSIGSLAGEGVVDIAFFTLTSNDNGSDSTFSGIIRGGGGKFVKEGTGTLTITEAQEYTGSTFINAGTLSFQDQGNLRGTINIAADGSLLLRFEEDILLDNDLNGDGTIVKEGSGFLEVQNRGAFNGNVEVREGVLRSWDQWDAFSSARVFVQGGTLAGNDRAMSVDVRAHGILSPDRLLNSSGIPSIEDIAEINIGTVRFGTGSTYEVDVAADGSSDLISADTVYIDGGVVHVRPRPGDYANRTVFEIIKGQSIVGNFDGATISDLAFLTPTLAVDGNTVSLALQKKSNLPGLGGGDVPRTANQLSAAQGIESTGSGNELYQNIIVQTVDGARQGFDAVSGESHPSQRTVFAQTGLTATNNTLDQALRGNDARRGDGEVMSFIDTGLVSGPDGIQDGKVWMNGFGSRGVVDATSNTAATQAHDGGVQIGADRMVGDHRLGGTLLVGRTGTAVGERGSSSESSNIGAGVYGSTLFGNTGAAVGVSYIFHDVTARRTVAFPGFSEVVSGAYSAGTSQLFGEINHTIAVGTVDVRPYARASYVHVGTQGFSESGGVSALSVAPGSLEAFFTTLGLRAETEFELENDMTVSLSGGVGWRHAFGDDPVAQSALAGGTVFTTTGAGLVHDAAVVDASVGVSTLEGSTFGVSYGGQLSGSANEHAVRAKLSLSF